jgi:Glycosyltransferase family 87
VRVGCRRRKHAQAASHHIVRGMVTMHASHPLDSSANATRPRAWGVACLLAFLLLELAWIYWVHSNEKLIDFYAYDVASSALKQGLSPYYMSREAIDAISLQRGLPASTRVPSYLYSPFLAAVLVPLLTFSAPTAAVLWSLGSLAALTLSGMLLSQISSRRWIDPTVFVLLLLMAPALTTFYAGQVNHYLLLTMTAAAWAIERGRARLVGAALAVGILVKTIPLSLVGILMLHRQWLSLRWLVLCALVLAATTMAWVGVDPYLAYFGHAWRLAGGGAPPMVPVNQSLAATTARLLGGTAAAGVALALSGLIGVCSLFILVRAGRHRDAMLPGIGLLMAAVALVAPISWSHHQILLTLPMVVLLRFCRNSSWQLASRTAVGVAVVLLAVVALGWRQLAPWPLLQSGGTFAIAAVWISLLVMLGWHPHFARSNR